MLHRICFTWFIAPFLFLSLFFIVSIYCFKVGKKCRTPNLCKILIWCLMWDISGSCHFVWINLAEAPFSFFLPSRQMHKTFHFDVYLILATSRWNKQHRAAQQWVNYDTVCAVCVSSGFSRDVKGEHVAEEPERWVQLHYRDWNPGPHRVIAV